jgi:hypothetical protein
MPSSAPTAAQIVFVARVRDRLPAGFPLVVNSYGRTPRAQAEAMLAKLQAAGGGAAGARELYDTYQDDAAIRDLLSLPHTVEAWAKRIAEKYPRLSRHLWGGAVDFQTRTLSSSQRHALEAAVVASGGRPNLESTPPHLHVDLPADLVGRGPGSDTWRFQHPAERHTRQASGDGGGGVLLAAAAIGVGAFLRSRRRRRT